jgi:hypothetical protein
VSYRILASLLLVLIAGPAWSDNGEIQINHQRALAGGVTPGDAAGYPVTLSVSGAYILTGVLTAPDQNTNIIEITADNVNLDMNGFTIVGTNLCVSPPTCSAAGTGIGIVSANHQLSLEHGLITGMGSHGISMTGLGLVFREMGVSHCAGNGIQTSDRAFFYDAAVGLNGGNGIVTGLGANLINTHSGINGAGGVIAGDAAKIDEGGFGANVGNGIVTGGFAMITGVNANGNGGNGITVSYGSLIDGCLAQGNTGTGIVFPATVGTTASMYKNCLISGNATATVTGTEGNSVGPNYCNGNAVCP